MIIIISDWTLISGTGSEIRGGDYHLLPESQLVQSKIGGSSDNYRKLGVPFLIPLLCLLLYLSPSPRCPQRSSDLTSSPSVTIYFRRVSPGLQRSPVISPSSHSLARASLVAQLVKNLPAVQETRGSIPGSGSSSEKGTESHSSSHAQRILWTEDPGRLESTGSQRAGHD